MTKILDRYLFRELVPPYALGVVLVTFLVLMVTILDLAKVFIRGDVSMAEVASIIFWMLPHILAISIPISVLLAANLGLGRMSADNEITAMRASGMGLVRIGRALLLFAGLNAVADAYVMVRLMPRSSQKARTQLLDLAKRQLHRGIQQGSFFESYTGYVIYASHIDDVTNVWSDVMVADLNKRSEPTITFAKHGRLRFNEAEKFAVLELEDGESFATNRQEPESSSRSTFTKETLLINLEQLFESKVLPQSDREMGITELLQEIAKRKRSGAPWRKYAVELHKRFAQPVACLVFGVFGLAVGAKNRSRGKSAGIVVSLAIIVVYWMFFATGERLGDQGEIPPWIAMWTANVVIGGAGLVLLVLAAREVDLSIVDRLATGIGKLDPRSRLLADTGGPRGGAARAQRAEGIVFRAPGFNPDSRRTGRSAPARRTILALTSGSGWQFPRTLDRYVVLEWARGFLVVLAAIVAIYVIIDLTGLVNDIAENQIATSTVIGYYGYAIGNITFLMLGPACLVTTLLVLGLMSRNNELVAMQASGISSYRIALPVVLCAALVSGASMVVNDRVLPHMNREAQTRREEIQGRAKRSHLVDVGSRWLWGKEERDGATGGRRLYNYSTYLMQENQMQGVTVYELDPSHFTVRRILYADVATWQDPGWLFQEKEETAHPGRIGAWSRRFEGSGALPFQPFDLQLVTEYDEGADYFVAERKAADELTFGELREYIASLEVRGFSVQHLAVRLYQKLSLPFVPLVMTGIGIPFAFRIGKRGNLFGVGVALLLLVLFWGCTAAFGPLGETGVLPAHLAAFAPNLIFLIGSAYLLLNLDG